jgi:tRNA threonylcarbamoyladenosine biosynthesis protein TsaB
MHILAIDTSNQALGVAIMKENEVIGEIRTNISKNHSVRLMPAIDYVMKEVNLTPDQLDKVVVAKGPGSYTGVRIGLTTAKTLAWSLNIPIVGVSSLEGLAYQGRFSDSLICPFFDARRGLVYTGLYQFKDGKILLVEEEQNTMFSDWLDKLAKLEQHVLFLSPDILKHKDSIQDKIGARALIPEMTYHNPKPSDLVLAASYHKEDKTHTLTPNYLRLAEAEANWISAQEDQKNG